MSEPTWELLGGGGVVGGPVDYIGDWAAGTQYQPGQVVRYGGVDYLAVNPSLGQVPPVSTAWPTPPRSVRARQATPQSVAEGATATVLIFDGADDWDTDAMHSPTVNNTRITIPAGLAGLWRFDIFWSIANPGQLCYLFSWLRKNGVAASLGGSGNAGNYGLSNQGYSSCSILDKAAVGDYYEAMVGLASGAARNTLNPYFAAFYLGVVP